MAITYPITLSTTDSNNNIGALKIRQSDEETQTLVVELLENGRLKSYEGLQVFFCAKLGQSDGLGIIEQKLFDYELINPKLGKLVYTIRPQDWQVLGRQTGYFSFRKMKDDHTYEQQFSTRNFSYEIVRSIFSDGSKQITEDGSTYIWTIEDLKRLFEEYIATGKTDWEDFVNQNKDIIESIDPSGQLLNMLGTFTQFRNWDSNLIDKTKNEFSERGINVKWFGAKLDGLTDDSDSLQAAINFTQSASSNTNVVHIPQGTMLLKKKVFYNNDVIIKGVSKIKSKIVNYDKNGNFYLLDSSLITSYQETTTTAVENFSLIDICIETAGERTVYPVDIVNTITPHIKNCLIREAPGTSSSLASKHGIIVQRENGYEGNMFLAKIEHSRFSRAVCHVGSTDSYLLDNEFWGNERPYAVVIKDVSNSIIQGNQIVGGETYGGVYITGTVASGLKITKNYFDGSYAELNTKWGVYSDALRFTSSAIEGNNFWRQKSGGVYLQSFDSSLLVENNFEENDYYGTGHSDIVIGYDSTPNHMSCFNNKISNSHFRQYCLSSDLNSTMERKTTNPQPVLKYKGMAGAPTLIYRNVVGFKQYYGKAEISGSVKAKDNNYPELFNDSTYTDGYERISGNASIPVGSTPAAVVIPHTLGYSPAGADIKILLTTPLYGARGFYLYAKTENSFTIALDTSGGAITNAVQFTWEIVRRQ
ncbi:BppU family phage baseplate upper protein [Enterococcus gallinarum]|uniref:BppU family phage baseplate upper protein n=1 Tax=Enterococcus gallinarum TaxID=1353 RepID=UPI000BBB9360|nr:BppU family phage baseplate upper protein [Enterococcus gallinarum]PCD91512.1 hypothetical protein CKY18_15200 [Enterococcus gallinarum]